MPSEIAKIYVDRSKNKAKTVSSHRHQHRRLLDTSECQSGDAAFDKKCQEKPKCGSKANNLKTCAEVAAAGLCGVKKYEAICCRSCAREKLYGCQDRDSKTGRISCTAADEEAIRKSPKLCNTYPAPGNKANAATRCKKYCWDYLGRPEWCLESATCADDQAALDTHCNLPEQAICGFKSETVTSCRAAERLGWCHGFHSKWMKVACPVYCDTCPTCETYTCPDTYVPRESAVTSTTLTTESCCVSKTKLCSCSWECMFSDSCCGDFSSSCCNEH